MKLLVLAALVAGCSAMGGKPSPAELPSCTTNAECRAHDGRRVQVIGVYSVWDPRGDIPPERSRSRMVKVRLGGTETGPFLHRAFKRPPAEIARFQGKRVRVIGTYLRDMRTPVDEAAAQLSGSSVIDIESLTLAE